MNKELKQSFLTGLVEASKDLMKEKSGEVIGELVSNEFAQYGLEIAGGAVIDSIPVVGRVVSQHYTKKRIKNTEILLSEIGKRVSEIEAEVSKKNDSQKELLDDLMGHIYEKAIQTNQTEKISYMINGFVNMTKIEDLSEDIAYIYYDALNQLTILDISVLKLYGKSYFDIDSADNYSEILAQFGIEYHQYDAVRKNLQRMTLLEDYGEEQFDKHFKEFVKVFNSNMKLLATFKNPKKFDAKEFGKLKDIKEYRPSERLKLSKFGREFLRFFVENS